MLVVTKLLTKIFGSRNDRLLKRYRGIVAQVAEQEPKIRKMTDEQMRARTAELRELVASGKQRMDDVLAESLAIVREAMDRNIGIRQIFNPEENFDPDKLSDELLEVYDQVQQRMIQTGEPWQKVSIPVALYDAVREMYPESRPPFRARPFDVQMIGGLVLYEGKIAEMATGEGKTFVGPLACFLRGVQGYRCHVVTVNDYLVKRDASWIRPAFEALGLSVGYIQSFMDPGGDERREAYACDVTYGTNSEFGFDYLRDNMKERVELQVQGKLDFVIVDEVDSILIDEARTPLIISGAAHDDAPKYRAADAVARKVIELNKPWDENAKKIDAAKRAAKAAEGDMDKFKGDKAKMDEARARQEVAQRELDELEAKKKQLTQYYEVELDRKSVHLTHEGISAAQDFAGVGSFYVGNNMEWPHLMEQAMRAHVVYEKDRDYVVERGQRTGEMEIIIVDEYTGRKMEGRQWSDGLHQSCEAKEKVPIKQETQTLATITLQNFFKLYKALSGMTGTAMTEAEEFAKIYRLEVVTIPTNRPVIRDDREDRIYRSDREKWEAILEEIKTVSEAGRPVLVGTTSVERSEMVSTLLKRKYGVKHEVLNAKHHEREAQIVAQAGHTDLNPHGERVGNVTIATNMAGRGTDIKLAPETQWDVEATEDAAVEGGWKYKLTQRGTGKVTEVDATHPSFAAFQLKPDTKSVGGLHVIGTERHTSRRIDNQLRGRSGRQGDPGSSRFYVSLQDDLMKMFAGEWVIRVLGWLGMEEGMAIEDKRITKGIIRAQKKVEERNFLSRKQLLDYDEVMDYQRTTFYGLRQRVLEGRDIDAVIWDMIGDATRDAVDKYITKDYVATVIAEWAKTNFEVNLEARDLGGMHELQALEPYIKDQAKNEAQTTITATIEEFIEDTADEDSETPNEQWDAKGLSSWAMSRFHVNLPASQVKRMSREDVEERLREGAIEQIDKKDVAGIERYLEPLYAEGQLAEWARDKFGIELDPKEFVLEDGRTRRDPGAIEGMIEAKARAAYARREIEYPIDHQMTFAFGGEDGSTDNPYAADFMKSWILAKYGVELTLDEIRSKSVRQLRDQLIGLQEKAMDGAAVEAEVDKLTKAVGSDPAALAKAANERWGARLTAKELTPAVAGAVGRNGDDDTDVLDPREELRRAARRFLRRELTDLEQFVLINILDQSWKDHLYAMDMLRSGVGLMSFAERDPRIIYKKEGYRYFEQMIQGVRDKVTDLIFKARVVGQAEAKSAYRETAAVHEDAGGYGVTENVQRTAAELSPEIPQEAAAGQPQGGDGDQAVKVRQIVNTGPKVGRNDPCPCGSGKKYKKCCGQHVA
ncbi:MAG: preprotein translocase subunit SecA [Phycisphaerae bacterium]|nr:preprotein translocase subunit SecA [Tepidisphaeraceae bacterium]